MLESHMQSPPLASVLSATQLEHLDQIEAFKPGTKRHLVTLYGDNARKQLAELGIASTAGDFGAMRRAAHSLKGVSASLGAAGMATAAARIEEMCLRGDDQATREVAQCDSLLALTLEALQAWVQSP
jgi:HPt (histidine-containing phosphotransfer) domain-containing protein